MRKLSDIGFFFFLEHFFSENLQGEIAILWTCILERDCLL